MQGEFRSSPFSPEQDAAIVMVAKCFRGGDILVQFMRYLTEVNGNSWPEDTRGPSSSNPAEDVPVDPARWTNLMALVDCERKALAAAPPPEGFARVRVVVEVHADGRPQVFGGPACHHVGDDHVEQIHRCPLIRVATEQSAPESAEAGHAG